MCHQTWPHSNQKCFLAKKFKNIDWRRTDVTLVSIALNLTPACNYIKFAIEQENKNKTLNKTKKATEMDHM